MGPGSKREKRIAQQAADREAFEAKKLRQFENPNTFKRVAEAEIVPLAKQVKEPARASEQLVQWTREDADVEGDWSWGPRSCLDADWDSDVHPFLVECARKTWLEIYQERTGGRQRKQKHIFYELWQICEEAQARIIEIERDDIEMLFRFRLGNLKRLYGVQQGNNFSILWWDPDHKIYPVEPD